MFAVAGSLCKRHIHNGTLPICALSHGYASRNDTEVSTASLNVMPTDMQVLPMMVLLFVVVVIIILRAAWKPLPVPDAAQREALLNKAKQQAG